MNATTKKTTTKKTTTKKTTTKTKPSGPGTVARA